MKVMVNNTSCFTYKGKNYSGGQKLDIPADMYNRHKGELICVDAPKKETPKEDPMHNLEPLTNKPKTKKKTIKKKEDK